jgi:AcrR family transcriptional regulator
MSDILSSIMTASPHGTMRAGRDLTIEERRVQILRAAGRCLAQRGYEAVRLKDIADEAGVTTGALQHYWESRDQLLQQAFEQVSLDLLDRWEAATAQVDDPWEQIVALIGQLARAPDVRRHRSLWPEFAAAAGRHPALRTGFAAICDAWRTVLTRAVDAGVERGQFAPVLPVKDVVTVLLTHMDGCEVALAADIGLMDAERLRTLTEQLAADLLRHQDA